MDGAALERVGKQLASVVDRWMPSPFLFAILLTGLLSPSLAGIAYDALGTYNPAFVVAGVAALVGSGAVLAAGRPQNTS